MLDIYKLYNIKLNDVDIMLKYIEFGSNLLLKDIFKNGKIA